MRHFITRVLCSLILALPAIGFGAEPHQVSQLESLSLAIQASKDMQMARENFSKDPKKAAEDLHEAVRRIRGVAMHAWFWTHHRLAQAEKELERTARDIAAGKVTTTEPMDRALAKAECALAYFTSEHAWKLFREKQPKAAGEFLEAAITSIENSASWSGYRADQTVLTDARNTAKKMIAGTTVATADADKTFESIKKQMESICKSVD